tara:strand:+ start:446 stop:811 length:366 start_codon:yes stop_codon:yes gene_type:complete
LIFKRKKKKRKIMSIIIYHKNLKKIVDKKLTQKKDLDYYKQIGSKLILNGLKDDYNIKTQIGVYIAFINQFQRMKLYKVREEDKEYYISCILALWKLEILDPDSPTDPIYIAPLRKIKNKV